MTRRTFTFFLVFGATFLLYLSHTASWNTGIEAEPGRNFVLIDSSDRYSLYFAPTGSSPRNGLPKWMTNADPNGAEVTFDVKFIDGFIAQTLWDYRSEGRHLGSDHFRYQLYTSVYECSDDTTANINISLLNSRFRMVNNLGQDFMTFEKQHQPVTPGTVGMHILDTVCGRVPTQGSFIQRVLLSTSNTYYVLRARF